MELEEVLKKYKKPKKPMPLNSIIRVFIREGIENFYICRKEDVDVLIEGVDRLLKENDLARKALIANSYEADERNNLLVKIQELQKENEKLKEIDLTTVHIKGVCDEKERWRNKIRGKIEEINKEINSAIDNSKGGLDEEFIDKGTELLAQKRVLQDLLKEE